MTAVSITIDLRPDTRVERTARGGYRSTKAWQAHLGPFGGYARSQADAKGALIAGLHRFVDEYANPTFITYRELTAVVWCQPDDLEGITWRSTVIGGTAGFTGTHQKPSRDEAIGAARYTLADSVAMVDVYDADTIEAAADWLDEEPTGEWGHDGRALRRYCAWQRARRWADTLPEDVKIAVGDLHTWAGHHQDEFLDRYDRPEVNA